MGIDDLSKMLSSWNWMNELSKNLSAIELAQKASFNPLLGVSSNISYLIEQQQKISVEQALSKIALGNLSIVSSFVNEEQQKINPLFNLSWRNHDFTKYSLENNSTQAMLNLMSGGSHLWLNNLAKNIPPMNPMDSSINAFTKMHNFIRTYQPLQDFQNNTRQWLSSLNASNPLLVNNYKYYDKDYSIEALATTTNSSSNTLINIFESVNLKYYGLNSITDIYYDLDQFYTGISSIPEIGTIIADDISTFKNLDREDSSLLEFLETLAQDIHYLNQLLIKGVIDRSLYGKIIQLIAYIQHNWVMLLLVAIPMLRAEHLDYSNGKTLEKMEEKEDLIIQNQEENKTLYERTIENQEEILNNQEEEKKLIDTLIKKQDEFNTGIDSVLEFIYNK